MEKKISTIHRYLFFYTQVMNKSIRNLRYKSRANMRNGVVRIAKRVGHCLITRQEALDMAIWLPCGYAASITFLSRQ